MKRRTMMALSLLTLGGALTQGVAEENEFPFYVGRAVCLECHDQGRPASGCTLKPIPEHLDSYRAFVKPQAESIAALSGVFMSPTQSQVCLSCHATGAEVGPRWRLGTFKIEDGVQCESCHDAGSVHVDAYRSGTEHSRPIGKRMI